MSNTVRDILKSKSTELHTVSPEDSVQTVLEALARFNIGAVMVTDGEELVGIVSERDCAIKVTLPGESAAEVKVAAVMTEKVATVEPDRRVDDCMREMTTRDIRHLPVMDDGALVGMVSIGDVVKATLEEQRRHISYLETYIRGYARP